MTSIPQARRAVFDEIDAERSRQELLYPDDQDQELRSWYLVLGTELGEVGEAILELRGKSPKRPRQPSVHYVREELLQVAAVAVAAIESIDRLNQRMRDGVFV